MFQEGLLQDALFWFFVSVLADLTARIIFIFVKRLIYHRFHKNNYK
jgi:hypothetical protein